MRYLISIFFCFNLIFSQSDISNLFSSLESAHDSVKINKLSEFSWKNRNTFPADAILAGKEALTLAEKHNNKHMIATLNNYLGVIYRNIGSIENAIKYFYTALKISKKNNDSLQIAYSYNNIGGNYRIQNIYMLALENIFNALQIFELLNNKTGIAYCTVNLGIIFYRQKNYDKAKEYLDKTVQIREEINDNWGKAVALNHIAEMHFEKGEYNIALGYYKMLIDVYSSNNDLKGLSAAYSGLAGVYYVQNNYEDSQKYRIKSIIIAENISYIDGLITNFNKIALVYAKLDMQEKGIAYLDSAKSLIENNNLRNRLLDHYEAKAEFFKILDDYEKAINYLKKYDELKDTLTSEENLLWMNEMETIYNVEKKQKEIELLAAELSSKRLQRNYLFVIAVLAIIIVIVVSSKYYSSKKASSKLLFSNKEKDKLFRILAHDLKNPFNSLLGFSDLLKQNYNSFSEAERIDAISEINKSSKKLYDLVKNLLDWVKAQNEGIGASIEIVDLNNLVEQSISLLRQDADNKKINIEIVIEENLKFKSDQDILQTIIRNVLSNSIKFTKEDGKIILTIFSSDKKLSILVKDSGVGMTEIEVKNLFELNEGFTKKGTKNETGTGIGLVIVKELVNKLNGDIEVKSEVNVGTEFLIRLPLKHEV